MVDIAVAYNPNLRCCDVVFTGTDFGLDSTPASAMLMSILTNGRAKPDDAVPFDVPDWSNPVSFIARGGWCGDALDAFGRVIGSRMWLLVRRLATEQTRLDCENYLAECLSWLETVRGFALSIKVRYVAPSILGYRVRCGNTVLQLNKALG